MVWSLLSREEEEFELVVLAVNDKDEGECAGTYIGGGGSRSGV